LEQEIPTLRDSIQIIQRVFQSNLKDNQAEIEGLANFIRKKQTITLDEIIHIADFKIVEIFKKLSIPAVFAKKIPEFIQGEVGKRLSWKVNEGPFQAIVKERDAIRFVSTNPISIATPTFQVQFISSFPTEFDKNVLFLDQSKIVGELYVRPWIKGDRMQPIGLTGSKLISDILKDDHVPASEKQERFVLCDDEKIICCIGHRIDRRSIANEQSKLLIRVEIQQ
jgi:tRNA(Ile)-lysidine synthetase-like protein